MDSKKHNFHRKRSRESKESRTLEKTTERVTSISSDIKHSSKPFQKHLKKHHGHMLRLDNDFTSTWSRKLSKSSLLENGKPVNKTVSIAFPSSILRHCHSHEQKTFILGQIARSCALFEVDEVIIFMDSVSEQNIDSERSPSHSICRILQYLETPAYLRRSLFPFHSDFRNIGLIPTLDMPHHVRKEDDSWYREGVTLRSSSSSSSKVQYMTDIDIGLEEKISVNVQIPPNMRVTVQINENSVYEIVSPDTPRKQHGLYWGYQTRLCQSFGEVFSSSPFVSSQILAKEKEEDDDDNGGDGGINNSSHNTTSMMESYDCIIGYSESGTYDLDRPTFTLPKFNHLLVIFGGEKGIEGCIEADENFPVSVKKISEVFHFMLNMCPTNGCKVVRTEDSIFTSLARLRPLIHNRV